MSNKEQIEWKCFECKWQYKLFPSTRCLECVANSNFTPLFKEEDDD